MHYSDSEYCPATFETYRERVVRDADLSLVAAKRILREHGVKGRSKLRAYEARVLAEEIDADACRVARASDARLYRWLVAHGLELSYGELAEIEAGAGVEVVADETNRGTYACYADVERVYAAAKKHKQHVVSTGIRLPYETESDIAAADEIIRVLRDAFAMSDAHSFLGKYGDRFISADVLVPIR